MPLYQYRCLEGGHTFEVLQKLDEQPIEKCQVCQGRVTKVFSTSVRLRNAGIYVFDRATGRDILHDD